LRRSKGVEARLILFERSLEHHARRDWRRGGVVREVGASSHEGVKRAPSSRSVYRHVMGTRSTR
jgi:hypothetical protein